LLAFSWREESDCFTAIILHSATTLRGKIKCWAVVNLGRLENDGKPELVLMTGGKDLDDLTVGKKEENVRKAR